MCNAGGIARPEAMNTSPTRLVDAWLSLQRFCVLDRSYPTGASMNTTRYQLKHSEHQTVLADAMLPPSAEKLAPFDNVLPTNPEKPS